MNVWNRVMMIAMKTLVVWNCGGDSLQQAQAEVESLEKLRSQELEVVTVGRALEWDGLGKLLNGLNATMFHFIGHGTKRGELEVNEGSGTVGRSIKTVLELVRASSPKLEGIFLSGCYTAVTGPEPLEILAPASGWVVGTTNLIDDDVAALFAPKFYESLIASSGQVSRAFNTAKAYSKADFDVDSPHTLWLNLSSLPAVDKMTEEVYAAVQGIFNRQAMQARMRDEVSFAALDQALTDISHALGTGEVLSRTTGRPIASVSFPAQWLSDPRIHSFAHNARRKINDIRRELTSLRRGADGHDMIYGNMLNFDTSDKGLSRSEWMNHANEIDRKRNSIIRAFNKLVEGISRPLLPLIELSFTKEEIAAASRDNS